MRTSQIIFNAFGLFIASMFVIAALSTCFIIMPGYPVEKRGWWHFLAAFEAVLTILIGAGALTNFAKRKLLVWPTLVMILGYCISGWLIPLAIWGVILLISERKRRQLGGVKIAPTKETSC